MNNKTRGITAVFCLLLALVLGSVAFGRSEPGKRGRGSARMYDTKTVETITGEVVAVNRVTPEKGRAGGVHLMVKTEKEEIAVYLGPQ
jgi:hypothetical protein